MPHSLYADLRETGPVLGASLARTEIKVMFGALLRRFTSIDINGEPSWMSAGPAATVGVAVQSLPVRLA